jgi:hypothetical protein
MLPYLYKEVLAFRYEVARITAVEILLVVVILVDNFIFR